MGSQTCIHICIQKHVQMCCYPQGNSRLVLAMVRHDWVRVIAGLFNNLIGPFVACACLVCMLKNISICKLNGKCVIKSKILWRDKVQQHAYETFQSFEIPSCSKSSPLGLFHSLENVSLLIQRDFIIKNVLRLYWKSSSLDLVQYGLSTDRNDWKVAA